MKLQRTVYAEICLDNLINNLNYIREINGNKNIIAVVKDNAYGHGIVHVSKKLCENEICMLAVSNIDEAIKLRESNIKIPILIMGVTPLNCVNELVDYGLTQTITSFEYAILLSERLKKISKQLRVHIKLETGMGRVGLFASDENYEIVNNIFRNPFFEVEGIYSHFSNADNEDESYTMYQYKLFSSFCNNLEKLKLNIKYKHISASSGILNFKHDVSNCSRPGLLLYGYVQNLRKKHTQFKPVMNLKAQIVHIKKIHRAESIGYGRTYISDSEKIIATVNLGYGDGFPRYLSNKGKVILKGSYANIVGNICMDQFMIDITHIDNVKLFDEVLLMGSQKELSIYPSDIAEIGNTICYEVLCGIRERVPRVYIDSF